MLQQLFSDQIRTVAAGQGLKILQTKQESETKGEGKCLLVPNGNTAMPFKQGWR